MKNRALIIAEAGVNHNGSMDLARKLVEVASEAGVDYVKFQSFKAQKLAASTAKKAAYQSRNTAADKDDSQFNMLRRLELTDEMHRELLEYCRQKGVAFLSSAFDPEGLTYLDQLGLDLMKVPSGEITNLPYLKKLAEIGKPVVLSTGMANLGEIEDALAVLESGGLDRRYVTVLHCNTEYPTPFRDVNLKAMQTIANAFKVGVGYSDHTTGIEVPVAAVAMGATVVEKHFTLDRDMEGPDHRASLEPSELKQMVQSIRNIEIALGDGIKSPSASESPNIAIARKSIFTSRAIKAGSELKVSDLVMKRPGDGISPMKMDDVLGRQLMVDVPADHQVKWSDLK